MVIKKNDFIEIEFTGRITNNKEIFDTNIKSDAKRAGFKIEGIKPQILSVGHKMLPSGFDDDLVGKEENIEYELKLTPSQAFGKRNSQLVKMIPSKYFHEQKITPIRGMQLNLDGQLVKVLSSDRGRTLVDFNNSLAGKSVTYTYKINKKITEEKERIIALQNFLFRQVFDYDIEGKVITFKIPKEAEQFIKMLSPKFEEIMGLKVNTKTTAERKK